MLFVNKLVMNQKAQTAGIPLEHTLVERPVFFVKLVMENEDVLQTYYCYLGVNNATIQLDKKKQGHWGIINFWRYQKRLFWRMSRAKGVCDLLPFLHGLL